MRKKLKRKHTETNNIVKRERVFGSKGGAQERCQQLIIIIIITAKNDHGDLLIIPFKIFLSSSSLFFFSGKETKGGESRGSPSIDVLFVCNVSLSTRFKGPPGFLNPNLFFYSRREN